MMAWGNLCQNVDTKTILDKKKLFMILNHNQQNNVPTEKK